MKTDFDRLLLDENPDALIVTTPEGIVVHWNKEAEAVFGFTPAEAVGRRVNDLIVPPAPLAEEHKSLREASETGFSTYESMRRRKDGSLIQIDVATKAVLDAQGNVEFIILSKRDVTHLKALRDTKLVEANFRDLLDSTPDGIVMVNPTGRIVFSNSQAEKLFGYEQGGLRAKSVEILFPERFRGWHVGYRSDYFAQPRSRSMGEGLELFGLRKDGTEFPVEFSLSPLETEEGTLVLSAIRDITERKQAEELRRESERPFREMLENVELLAMTLDKNGTVTFCNAYLLQLTGWKREEILGKDWFSKFIPERSPEFKELFFDTINAGKITPHHESPIKTREGELREIVWNNTMLRDVAGNIIGTASIGEDVTDRKRAEAELEQTHRELMENSRQAGMADVAASVLHNVGNVLNSVNVASTCLADSLRKSKAANLSKVVTLLREHEADLGAFLTTDAKGKLIPGYLSQLAEDLSGEQAAALKKLAQLQKNVEHMKDIVSMQQNYGRVSGVAERVNAMDLVEDALRMNASSLSRHDIQILKEFEEVPPVMTQKHKVLQILVNLIRNATQACDESGHSDNRLILCIGRCRIGVRLSVSDSGVGILPENLTRIFAHGFTTKKHGHGFGLHDAALAAKDLGGSLTVRSDGAGHGATFILELPLELPGGNTTPLTKQARHTPKPETIPAPRGKVGLPPRMI